MVFCMEVAIRCMPAAVEQCILIFDACCLKKGTPGLSAIVQLLKVIGEHYPERVARTFVVDAPPMFYLLWKGIGKLFDVKMREKLRFVFSRNYISPSRVNSSDLVEANTSIRAATLSGKNLLERDEQQRDLEEEHHRGNADSQATTAEASVCIPHLISTSDTMKGQVTQTPNSPSRPAVTTLASLLSSSSFSLTASSSASTSLPSSSMLSKSMTTSKSSSTSSLFPSFMSSSTLFPALHHSTTAGPALTSDKNQARSLSFASTLTLKKEDTAEFRSFRADARPRRVREEGSSRRWTDLTFGFNKKDDLLSGHIDTAQKDKNYALFKPYYTAFLATPYSEVAYRAHMKPPLAGLISILGPDIKLRQPSFSIHTCTAMEAMLHHLHLD